MLGFSVPSCEGALLCGLKRQPMTKESAFTAHYIRDFERYAVSLGAHAVQDGFEIPCTVRDISAGGARLTFDPVARSTFRGLAFQLAVEGLGTYACHQRWQDRHALGVEFRISPSVQLSLQHQLAERFAGPRVSSTG